MRSIVAAVPIAVIGLIAPAFAAGGVATAAPSATMKCRAQTITYTAGKKTALDMNKGPKVRTKASGEQLLTDNRIKADLDLNDDSGIPTRYLNITTDVIAGEQMSRLLSVTLYPKKGKKKTIAVGTNPNKDYIYKDDLLKDHGQVLISVSGHANSGRKTLKLSKVVVKAKESCFATQ